MKRYWIHKLAQLTVFLQICLAPVLLGVWYLSGKSGWARSLLVLNIRTMSKIINNESRHV